MAVIDHDAELAKAGANVHGWIGALLFFVRRYPLGAIGAVIGMRGKISCSAGFSET